MRLLRPHEGPIALGDGGWEEWQVDAGATGEIVVSGGHVLPGYLNDPESDRQNKIHDAERIWHRSGDGGRFDAEGRLWLMGRMKRRVRRDGIDWWPLPAELRAVNVPGVAHAAYVGMPGTGGASRALLCIEADRGGEAALTHEVFARALDPWPMDELVLLERIPRDPRHQSKTDHEALMRVLEQRSG